MFNLLIVDDEVTAVKGLAYGINWNDIGIDEIFTAYNGQEALEIIKNNKIDILISDIRMPLITGLQLAEKIQETYPLTKIILISGYDEFDYAQEAIKYQVFRYLTKPIANEEVKDVAKNALEDIKNNLRKNQELENANLQIEEMMPYVIKDYYEEIIIKGNTFLLDDKEANKYLSINTDDYFIMLACKFDGPYINMPLKTRETYKLAFVNTIKKYISVLTPIYNIYDHYDHLIFVYSNNSISKLQELDCAISKLAETMQYAFKHSLSHTLSMAWSKVSSISNIHETYKSLNNQINRHLHNETGIIISPCQKEKIQANYSLLNIRKCPTFKSLLESYDVNKCVDKIELIFKEHSKLGYHTKDLTLNIFYTLTNNLIESSISNNISVNEWIKDESYLYSYESIDSIKQLEYWLITNTKNYIKHILSQTESEKHTLIRKAKQYILDNYTKQILLNDIANDLFIHPNYLSKLFKDTENINITQYITNLRIEHAKELLSETNYKIYEIAESCGYSSTAHFNRTFKREVGVSPKEYK
ncbi:hypothetical protein AN1V17_04490 [Vallitalea sediminicola]